MRFDRMSLLRVAPLTLSFFVAAPTAHADRELFGRPVTEVPKPSAEEYARRKAALQEHLDANGLVFDGDKLVPRADLRAGDDPQQGVIPWEDEPHYATIFLNFFGGPLTNGTNAAAMESGCVDGAGIMYPPFAGNEAFALTVIQVFENAMAPYAVRIAYEEAPPSHLPYSMVMMGGSPQDIGLGAGILGVSCSSDCGDQWWRDTTFAFTEESSSSLTLGNTALQEAAHAFGLDHIDGSEHIMYPFADSGAKIWADGCTPYNDATGGISCTYVHDAFCGADAGMQDDHAELLAFFGPNEPDISPPTVTITEPADGTEYPGPTGITIAADIADDHDGFGWRLVVLREGSDPQTVDAIQFEKSWNLDLPEGVYTIRVEAVDHDRNTGEDEITIYVGEEAPMDTGVDSSGSGDGTEGGNVSVGNTESESGNEDDDDDESGGPMQDDGASDRGCNCGVGSRPLLGFAWLGALAIAITRRRRDPLA
jgi:MYXO-CTERM domain-containing protein